MMGIIWEYQDFKNVCQYLWHSPGGGHPVWLTYHHWHGDLRYTQCFSPFVQHPWLWDIGSRYFSPHAHRRHFCMQQIKNERRQTEMAHHHTPHTTPHIHTTHTTHWLHTWFLPFDRPSVSSINFVWIFQQLYVVEMWKSDGHPICWQFRLLDCGIHSPEG